METPAVSQSSRSTGPPWGLCLWLAVAILWVTWSPFVPRASPWEPVTSPPSGLLEAAGNFLLFAPLAFVVGRSAAEGSEGRPSLYAAGGGLLVACVLVEGGQILVEGRLVSPYDFVLNFTGGLFALWTGFNAAELKLRHRQLLDRGLLVVLAVGYLGVLSILALRIPSARAGLELEGWEDDYPVRVGDEVGGNRTYQGAVDRARICAGASADPVCLSGEADESIRRRLVRAAQASQAFSIDARVRSQSSRQYGPTRIITFSEGPDRRNVTLGQSGNDLILRLRTPMGGSNGTGFAFRLEDAIREGGSVDVKATYRDSLVRLSATTARTRRYFEFTLTPTWVEAWLVAGSADPGYDEQPLWTALVGGLLVFVPPGLAAGWLLYDRRLLYASLGGAVAAVLLMLPIAVAVTGSPNPAWLGLAGAVGALSGWTGMRDRLVWIPSGP